MDLAQKPLRDVLARLPRLEGEELSIELALLAAALHKELTEASPDGQLLFSAAFEGLRVIPPGSACAASVGALVDIAVHSYIAAKSSNGIEPIALAVIHARRLSERLPLCRALKIQGVLRAETGNFPGAMEAYAEALDLSIELGDRIQQYEIWNNLGVAHMYACQYADATACYERAIEIASEPPRLPGTGYLSYGNIALASLHLGDFRKGLRAAQQAIEACAEPDNAEACVQRVFAENYFTRLLLEIGGIDQARMHAAQARKYADASKSQLGEIMAEIAEGLSEIHGALADVGLTRLKRALNLARGGLTGALQDTLAATISGYEKAGQPDVALVYLRELLRLRADAKESQVLMHHMQHLRAVDRTADAEIAQVHVRHEQELRGQLSDRELLKARIGMLEQSALAAELHDDTTGEHAYRVGRLASLLAKEYGVDDDTCFLIDLAARLHDIGKLAVPDSILLKPGKLTPGEFEIMMTHTTQGADLLAKSAIPQMHVAEEIARGHHEKWDGSGYPQKLKGSAIPLAARISALADVYDALTHERPYKRAWSVEESLAEIAAGRGKHFDPELTDIFLELVPRLRREHGDLDTFLAADAKTSPFIKARAEIARKLKGPEGNGVLDIRR